MPYIAKVTKKGQVVIPKLIRDTLGITANGKVSIELDEKKQAVVFRPAVSLLELAGKLKPKKKPVDPVRIRVLMDKEYNRV